MEAYLDQEDYDTVCRTLNEERMRKEIQKGWNGGRSYDRYTQMGIEYDLEPTEEQKGTLS